MAKNLFDIKEIDGQQRAVFHLEERHSYFHAKFCYYDKAIVFLKFVSDYCNKVAVKGASDIDIARSLFGSQQPTQDKYIRTVALLMASYTDNYLLKYITRCNAKRFKSKIDYLGIDFEYLSYCIENTIYNKNLPAPWWTSGHRSRLASFDIMMAMKSLFYIETIDKIEDMWNSDLPTGAIMYLRLYIDELLKRFIPYHHLENASGKPVDKTGVRRDFLKQEIKKRTQGQTSILLDEGELLVYAYEWCCDAVHYGSLPLDCLADWMIMKISPIKKIFSNEALMKTELQTYVSAKYPKEGLVIKW